jgi:hypothetical protein
MAYVLARAILNPSLAPPLPREEGRDESAAALALDVLTSFVPLAALILSVLGAIFFGFATPTEAAAVGALGAVILAACYRALSWTNLREAVYLTARTSAMVCFLFIGSSNFASVYSYLGGQRLVEEFMLSLDLSPLTFLLLTQAVIFLLGWPLEWTEIIIIFVPIFLPLLDNFGIDPIFLRRAGGAQSPDRLPQPADGDVRLLPEGHLAVARDAGPDLQRLHALHAHRRPGDGAALHLPGHRPLAAARPLRVTAMTSEPSAVDLARDWRRARSPP